MFPGGEKMFFYTSSIIGNSTITTLAGKMGFSLVPINPRIVGRETHLEFAVDGRFA
jgi:hypothetical protein